MRKPERITAMRSKGCCEELFIDIGKVCLYLITSVLATGLLKRVNVRISLIMKLPQIFTTYVDACDLHGVATWDLFLFVRTLVHLVPGRISKLGRAELYHPKAYSTMCEHAGVGNVCFLRHQRQTEKSRALLLKPSRSHRDHGEAGLPRRCPTGFVCQSESFGPATRL